jgi:hypothetical protein
MVLKYRFLPAFHIRFKIAFWAYFEPPSPREKVAPAALIPKKE